MRKKIKFNLVADNRFNGSRNKLIKMANKVRKSGVKIVEESSIRELTFPSEDKSGEKTKQWRITFIVDRENETWNTVRAKINSIYTPYYKFI